MKLRNKIFTLFTVSMVCLIWVASTTFVYGQTVSFNKFRKARVRLPLAIQENVSSSTVGVGININASNRTGAQSETNITIDPANPARLVAGSNDIVGTQMRAYYSINSGASFLGSAPSRVVGGFTFGFCSDPALAFDLNGNVYYNYLVIANDQARGGLVVAKSTTGGATWNDPAVLAVHTTFSSASIFEDKCMMVIDTNLTSPYKNNIYSAWDRIDNTSAHVMISRSTDGGLTYSTPSRIDDSGTTPSGAGNIYATPAVGPNGEVYVIWDNYDSNGNNDRLILDKSTNGGASWGTDKVVVSNLVLDIFSGGTGYFVPAQPDRGIAACPSIDVDRSNSPRKGWVYLTWCDASGSQADTNIYFSRSTDGGNNWSAKKKVNDDNTNRSQFFQWLSVDPVDGSIHISWYDARDDSNNKKVHVYYTRSTDGGNTFEPNIRVTDVQSDESVDNNNRDSGNNYGDYEGIVAYNGIAYPVWTDTRNSSTSLAEEVYVARLTLGSPTTTSTPPVITNIPNPKLFIGQSLNNAFDLEDFNTSDRATAYNILENFLVLSSLTGSTVSQSSYTSATSGSNTYELVNALGSSTAINQVKYSTYKIQKLPKVGLNVGSSWDVNVANLTIDSTGNPVIPPSFGNSDSLSVSDFSKVSAEWLGDTAVRILALQSFTGAVNVDITASHVATSPFGSDIDKERIQVYNNFLGHSTFSTANDTTIYSPLENAPGRTVRATQSWLNNYTDSAGTQANGVWQFNFASGSDGVKATPGVANWLNVTNGQWYTIRMRVVADTPNSHQSVLFGFNNYLGAGLQTDIAANILFGIPTVWTWQETPMMVHGTTTTGYPQFQFKAAGPGNVYVDEIQIINSAPTLVDANRANTRLHYAYGDFNVITDTTGWGQEIYTGSAGSPVASVDAGQLRLDFVGAGSGNNQRGLKWTANNGVSGVGAYTQSVATDRQIGLRLTVTKEFGLFNSLAIVYLGAYGVQTNGQQVIAQASSNLIASAIVGTLVDGTYRTVGNALNPFYQFQFGVRSDIPGILRIDNVDFDMDQDDPNFGDATLFP